MSNIYSNADSRFQQRIGADELVKVRHNKDIAKPLTIDEAAEFLGISRDTLNQLFNKKLLRSYHVGRRRFVTMEAITDFISNQEEVE